MKLNKHSDFVFYNKILRLKFIRPLLFPLGKKPLAILFAWMQLVIFGYSSAEDSVLIKSDSTLSSSNLIHPLKDLIDFQRIVVRYSKDDQQLKRISDTKLSADGQNSILSDNLRYKIQENGMPFVSDKEKNSFITSWKKIDRDIIDHEDDPRDKALKVYWGYLARLEKSSGVLREYDFIIQNLETSKSGIPVSSAKSANIQNKASKVSLLLYEIENIETDDNVLNNTLRQYQMAHFPFQSVRSSVSHFSALKLPFGSSSAYDQYSIFSPALSSCREVPVENQGDSLLNTSMSFDDLFIFSEKPYRFNISWLRDGIILAPDSDNKFRAEQLSGDKTESIQYQIVSNKIFDDSGHYNDFTGIVSTSPILDMKLKDVWILKADSSSPLYAKGYSHYYVGKDDLLPYFKVSYSFAGEPLSLLIATWGMISLSESSKNQNDKVKFDSKPILLQLMSFNLSQKKKYGEVIAKLKKIYIGTSLDYLSEIHDQLCSKQKP
ncbi:MAG TPA: hypothetical protein PKA63_03860 [Oligoflexia bacterium]|nr:hypothetical protein [Oligoflexia bacterium]HMP47787.1 hypothetical protein [Oligoflexia bacterium]